MKPKQESKLFKLEFEPQQAFDNLRKLARGILSISKKEVDDALANERVIRKRHKLRHSR